MLARRLSNAEYNYTIRDLTGVDIRPTREFPVDPANTAGFDNSGESLTMSPALLNKYLQAAREVADHMVLTPDGIDFAPYPMLVETDRDKYAIQRIVDFYERQPTDYADYFQAAWRFRYRSALGKPDATLAGVAAESKVSAKYLPMVWRILEERRRRRGGRSGRSPSCRRCGARCRRPAEVSRAVLRAQCVEMRDFVVRIRAHTAMQFAAPVVQGLPAGSQPLLNWKLRQFNSHRRDSDPNALRNDTDPPPVVAGNSAISRVCTRKRRRAGPPSSAKARAGDTDLVVPAAERTRYEASFARFASVFPDAFYVTERGRYFPDDSRGQGPPSERRLPQRDGLLPRRHSADGADPRRKGAEGTEPALGRVRFHRRLHGPHLGSVLLQSERRSGGQGRGVGPPRPADKAVNDRSGDFRAAGRLSGQGRKPSNNPVAVQAIRDHFERVNATLRRMERSGRKPSRASWKPCSDSPRAPTAGR